MLLLTALEAIATERYRITDPSVYDDLPFNYRVSNDFILIGGRVVVPSSEPVRLDIALVYNDPVARRGLRLGEIGDLAGTEAMDTLDVSGLFLHIASPSALDEREWWLIPGDPVVVTVRREARADAEIVMRLPPPR